jgi:hypothetical protein
MSTLVLVPLVVGLVVVPAAPAAPAPPGAAPAPGAAAADGGSQVRARRSLVVTGRLRGAGPSVRVLLVGADGTSVSTAPSSTGAFTLRVTNARLLAKLVTGRRGTGPALQLVRSGDYAGPVVLRVKRSVGFGRLAPTLTGTVDVGTLRYKAAGYALAKKAVATTRLDTRHTMRLAGGVPLGAGTFGATGRLRTSALRTRSVAPAGELPPDLAGLGADADRDGVPNVADVDMNGDQVLDAAQAESALPTEGGGTLTGTEVLAGRPRAAISFRKILNTDSRSSVNSNVTPGATWEQLGGYLRDNLMIETIVGQGDIQALLCPGQPFDTPCAAAQALARVTMDCRTLDYCQPGTPAVIRAQAGSGLDGQPLSVLFDEQGLITLPQDTHYQGPGTAPWETGFQLNFLPSGAGSSLQFVGDAFEFAFYDAAGVELARQVKVLTSSVVTAPEFTAVAGSPAAGFDDRTPLSIPAAQAGSVAFEFVRPQRLGVDATAPTPTLLDRGGLEYKVYAMTQQDFYWCRPTQVTPTSPDLTVVTVPNEPPGRDRVMFDTAGEPANGGRLSFTLDLQSCLTDPLQGPGSPPPAGTTISIEMESADSDDNNTRTRAYLRLT